MYRLVETCGACPEQYDVFNEGNVQVGYIRLRHGTLRVDCPDCGGETVYTANPKGDGRFLDNERDFYLKHCLKAIKDWEEKVKSAPDISYTIEPDPRI